MSEDGAVGCDCATRRDLRLWPSLLKQYPFEEGSGADGRCGKLEIPVARVLFGCTFCETSAPRAWDVAEARNKTCCYSDHGGDAILLAVLKILAGLTLERIHLPGRLDFCSDGRYQEVGFLHEVKLVLDLHVKGRRVSPARDASSYPVPSRFAD